VRLAWAVVVLSMAPATLEAAQRSQPKPGSAAAASQASGPDLFAGYSYTEAGAASLHGLQISAAFGLWKRTRLAVELSRHSGSFAGADLKQLSFLTGPRRVWRSGSLSPFAQVLVGVARATTSVPGGLSDSTTGWGIAPGGGVDYRLSRHWGARAEARLLFLRGGGVWDKDLGLAIGVTYRLGR
jgi:outer membrane protein with beta-barrel domain